jgi:putative ABC transport system ATP-binding protein
MTAVHPANNSAPLMRLENLSKTYGFVDAVHDVTLKVHAGEFVAITGPSGSGKSTLLGILGLLEHPSAGRYYLQDQNVTNLGDLATSQLRNRHFGFVFQQFHLLPDLSAWENVARVLLFAGIPKHQRKPRAVRMLEMLGLAARVNHRPAELSGGEQQRVALARALVNDPEVILADEPTGNLPQAQWEPLLGLLATLNRQGKTVILVTHDPNVAAWANRQIRLQDGRICNDHLAEPAGLALSRAFSERV